MGSPGLSMFTITLEQDEVNVKGVLTVLCRDVIQLLDMIRDVINEPFAWFASTSYHSSSGTGLKGSLSLYLLKMLTRLYVNTQKH